jgi:signal peptidase I
MQPSEDDTAGTSWSRLVVVVLARAYRAVLLTLATLALAPMLLDWGSYVVETGSMRPSIAVGDVVVAKPVQVDDTVHVGRVYVFDDPSRPDDRLLVHRVVERRDDGDFTSAGDANQFTDTTPLSATDLRAQAILLVPFVGRPVVWLDSGQWLPFAAWLLLTILAFGLATLRPGDGRPPRDRWRRRSNRSRQPGSASGRVAVARSALAPTAVGAALLLLGVAPMTVSAAFTTRTTSGSNSWTVGSWVQRYVGTVLTDQPYGFWLLDEPSGSSYATDRSGHNRTGQYYGALTLGRPGGLPTNPGTSVGVTGGRVVLGPNLVASPAAYSIELWMRTTSTSGGYVAGFEDDRDDNWRGADADRILFLRPSGQLTFGLWSNRTTSITTPRAYNDGAWHHVVVTSTSARSSVVYVDGVAVTSGTTSPVESYPGYWRIGQGSTGNQNGVSSSFPGDLDNVAVYHSVLSPARVAAHWDAR